VPKSPTVVLDSGGRRVRLRGAAHALEGCLSSEDGKETRFRLEPDRWTPVNDQVYAFLKGKFARAREREVPDWEPGGENDSPRRTPRTESEESYIIEGLN